MAKVYGAELAKLIEAEKQRYISAIEDRQRRINNWETDEDDCFMSQRVEERGIHECDMKLEILQGDGTMPFEAVVDQEGNEVGVRWVHTRFGGAYVGRGIFASSKKALCKKTGWHTEEIRVPVWIKLDAGGTKGLYGAYIASPERVRWHTNMVTGEYVGYPE